MAEMPLPYYWLQADGPSETGLTLLFQLETGAAGPLPAISEAEFLAHLKTYLAGDSGDVTVRLTGYDVAVTNDL